MSAPLILGTNSIKDVGYNVDNSLRFNDGSSDYLNRTPSSAGNTKTFTFSTWSKRSDIGTGADQHLLSAEYGSNINTYIYWSTNNNLVIYAVNSVGDIEFLLQTTQVFRDVSAWYHIVVAVDTTQSTDSNRVKVYINGTQVTNFTQVSTFSFYPTQNFDTAINQNTNHEIGRRPAGTTKFYDGYLCETVLIDGSQLDPNSFGEFDEDSSIWKPKDVSGLTFGSNGFYLNFSDSSSLGADVSGNNNDFTVNNLTSIDQTTDTCTNNYATLNPLDNYYYNSTFSDGNLKQTCNSANYSYNTSTFGVSQGKWYVEIKNSSSGTIRNEIGIIDRVSTGSTTQIYGGVNGYGWFTNGNVNNNSSIIATYSTWTAGDIMGIALDLDNNKVYFAKNGTWQNSADPSAGTNGISITDPASTLNGVYFIATGDYGGSDNSVNELNFGNPPFTISSGNSDGNGYGNFEYSVPSGYYALNTKNLAEYG